MQQVRTLLIIALISFYSSLQTAQAEDPMPHALAMGSLGFTVHHPDGWSALKQGNVAWIVNGPDTLSGDQLHNLAQIFVTVEHRSSQEDGVRRLRQIASAYQGPVTYLALNGWPAMRQRVVAEREQPGTQGSTADNEHVLRITTAIAAGDLLIRADGRMPVDVGGQTEGEVIQIESAITLKSTGNTTDTEKALEQLRADPQIAPFKAPPAQIAPASPVQKQGSLAQPQMIIKGDTKLKLESDEDSGSTQVIAGGWASEPEVAASTDGQKIVVAQQFQYSSSNDGGATFPNTGFFTSTGGDTSLAYGKTGNFYEGTINGQSTALNTSTDGGKTFSFTSNAFTCSSSGANQCGFNPSGPDQEHIAADRFNASNGGGDQVYFAWRQGNGNFGLVCSTDSGSTFGTPVFTAGDFPRITVGQDGSVYVVYVNGGTISVDKFSSCQNGLSQQTSFPATIAVGIGVTCPIPGLDRCNNGNILASPTVAVDDTDASHVYAAYAQSSGSGENVVLQDSADGGVTWTNGRAVTLNANTTARRFMPWMCASGGRANVTWYDRRSATTANTDLTDYYGATAGLTDSNNLGNVLEYQLNAAGSADTQCLAGKAGGSQQSWAAGSRAQSDSTSCSEQPELGGRCSTSPSTACNFAATTNTCPGSGTCQTSGGIPKYGDYNGNACAAGKLFSVWASATPPPGLTPTGNVDLYIAINSLTPPACSISYKCEKGVGGPPFYTVQCPGVANYWWQFSDNTTNFLGTGLSQSGETTDYADQNVLACNTGTGKSFCLPLSVSAPATCPSSPPVPVTKWPACCKACLSGVGGICSHNTVTGGCTCE